jgi:hypothetical protein
MRWTRQRRACDVIAGRGLVSDQRHADEQRFRRRGEHEISRKTIAQGMPGVPGYLWWLRSCALFISHARLRVHWAPGIPLRPLSGGRFNDSGASRRGNVNAYLMNTNAPHFQSSSPAHAGDPVFQRRLRVSREVAAYWIVRSSRTMTAAFGATKHSINVVPANAGTHNHRRPLEQKPLATVPKRESAAYGSPLSRGRQWDYAFALALARND